MLNKTETLPMVVGLNHKTAPIEMREKVVFNRDTLPASLNAFVEATGIQEVVILSTCNRTEIYTQTTDTDSVLSWLAKFHHLSLSTLKAHAYIHTEHHTAAHAMRVASSLDSMVLGETQILGQLKQAVSIAEKTGTLGHKLRRLFDRAFSTAKQIRTQTQVGANPISLGYVILQLARNIFTDLSRCRVLLMGAGEMIDLTAKYFQSQGITHFWVANRNQANAEKIALPLGASVITLSEITDHLADMDILVSAIHCKMPLMGKGMIETALKYRKHRPVLMVDLGIPRNIESEIKSLEDVYLYHIDDMQFMLAENYKKRFQAVDAAEDIIALQASRFCEEMHILKVNHRIQTYRSKMYKIRDRVLQDALGEIARGESAEEVLHKMAYQLSNKLLHEPCLWLREAAKKS